MERLGGVFNIYHKRLVGPWPLEGPLKSVNVYDIK